MRLFNWLGLYAKIERTREARVLQLEDQIVALEKSRDDQIDLNARIRRDHEDAQRKSKHAHEDRIREMKSEIESLQLKARVADEELGHLMKIRDEKAAIELERKRVDLERAKNDEIATIKAEYQEKIEEHLEERIEDLGKMYGELLARLPNIDVALKGRVGG